MADLTAAERAELERVRDGRPRVRVIGDLPRLDLILRGMISFDADRRCVLTPTGLAALQEEPP